MRHLWIRGDVHFACLSLTSSFGQSVMHSCRLCLPRSFHRNPFSCLRIWGVLSMLWRHFWAQHLWPMIVCTIVKQHHSTHWIGLSKSQPFTTKLCWSSQGFSPVCQCVSDNHISKSCLGIPDPSCLPPPWLYVPHGFNLYYTPTSLPLASYPVFLDGQKEGLVSAVCACAKFSQKSGKPCYFGILLHMEYACVI